MPEETRVTTQPSSQSADDQRRIRSLNRTLLIGLLIAALTVASYTLLYFQTQAWQILAVAAGVASGAVCILPARRRLRQNDLDGAGYWLLAAIVLAFGVGEVFWINNTLFATAGALLLFLLVGSLVRPRRWGIWAAVAVAYGGFIVAVNQIQPLPRYDIAQVQLLNAFIPIAIGALLVAVLWLIARAYLNYSLRTKLIVAFLAVSLVSVGAIALYADRTIRLALQDQSSSALTNVAQLQGTTIGDLLVKEVQLLRTASLNEITRDQATASNASYQGSAAAIQAAILVLDREWIAAAEANDDANPLIRSRLDNPIAEHLREYRALYPENVEVFVTDRYGALLGATNRTSDYYQADEAWWQAAFNNGQGAIYYTQPDYDASSAKYSIDIAFPLYDRDGKTIVGVMRTTVDLAAIVDLLANAHIGQTGRADMLLPNSKFVEAQGPKDVPPDLLAKLPAQLTGAAEVNWLDGVPSFAAVAPVYSADPELGRTINQLNWQIIAHQSRAEVLAPVEAQSGAVLLVIAFVAAIVAGASVGLSQVLARPIAHLTAVAKKVSEGDLTTQAAVETGDEVGTLAVTFNKMTAQLRTLVGSLEDRVQARTEQLRTSADVGRAAASTLDPDQLLREIVNLITDRFGFYYTAVFTLDSAGKFAVLREATGEAGRALKERHHQLEVDGQSMVGYVTARRKARIALDVGAEAVRFANPLLPETRSEIALPLMVGERVLGALDVQSKHEAAFDEASAAVLQAMADQIAIALNNATLFVESQTVARRSHALYDASREVGHLEADPATTIGAMMRTVSDVLGLQMWWVLIFDERRTMLTTLSVSAAVQGWPNVVPVAGFENNPIVRSAVYSESHIINDPLNDPYLKNAPPEQRFLLKTISVPIITRGASVGAMVLGRALDQPDLAQGDLEVAQSLASLTAIAIENSRLLSQTQRALSELDAINRRLTGEGWTTFTRRRAAAGVMWISTSDRGGQQALPEVAEALARGQIATRSIDGSDQLGVAVPIKLRDVAIGALCLVIPQRTWNADMITTLDSIAGHIAQAAENARLLEQTQHTAQREKAIAGAADKIHRATDLDTVLRAAIAEINRITGLGGVSIQLGFGQSEPTDGNGHGTGTEGGK